MIGLVTTTAGMALLTQLTAAGGTLTITKVQVGSGTPASKEAARALNALVTPQQLATSNNPVCSGTQASLILEYRNDLNGGLVTGFTLAEFGVFGKVGAGSETLIFYASLGENSQPVLPESAGLDVHRFPIAWAVTDDVTVTLEYAAGAFVSQDDLDGYLLATEKGAAGGVATLDGNGRLSAGEIPDIDCGEWDVDPVAEHNAQATAHANLLVDGNEDEAGAIDESLAEHMVNPLAHQNLLVDGNAGM